MLCIVIGYSIMSRAIKKEAVSILLPITSPFLPLSYPKKLNFLPSGCINALPNDYGSARSALNLSSQVAVE